MVIFKENFKTLFQNRLSKTEINEVVEMASSSKFLFGELISVIIYGSKHEAFMAAWVLGYAGIKKSDWFYTHLPELLKCQVHNPNESVLRNIVRVIWKTKIPLEKQGLVTQKCVEWIENKDSSIAVKAFSLHVLSKIIEHEPELCREIKAITESILPYATSGLANSAEKLLKKINKMGY